MIYRRRKISQEEVLAVIRGERDYQDQKWAADGGSLLYTLYEHLAHIRSYVNIALMNISSSNYDERFEALRKIAATAVLAMEQNGIKPRTREVTNTDVNGTALVEAPILRWCPRCVGRDLFNLEIAKSVVACRDLLNSVINAAGESTSVVEESKKEEARNDSEFHDFCRFDTPEKQGQPGNYCGETSAQNYICTRDKGHEGRHVAHVGNGQAIDAWHNLKSESIDDGTRMTVALGASETIRYDDPSGGDFFGFDTKGII